jgi:hypothetical protein
MAVVGETVDRLLPPSGWLASVNEVGGGMASAVDRARALRICLVQMLAAMLLALAALALPWATLKNVIVNVTTGLRGGPISVLLVLLAASIILLAALANFRASPLVHGAQVVLGCVALVASIALALSKIASANHQALARGGPSQTAYAIGGPIAVAASLVIVAASLIGLAGSSD